MRLKNERLEITFADGNELKTPRFDHTGFITQVVLDEKYELCTKEQFIAERRNSNGCGLCGEFVLAAGELAKKGEWYLKPGTGLVKQNEEFQRFNIFGTYELKPFPVIVEQETENCVQFYQKGTACNGYCTDIRKTFKIQGNQLFLEIEVCNTGEKEIEISEYQHNFVNIENFPMGPGYQLEVLGDKKLLEIEDATLSWGDERHLKSAVYVKDNTICWQSSMDEKVLYHESQEICKNVPYQWTLSHNNSPLIIKEEVGFEPSMFIIWGVEHCVCAEFYHTVKIFPGESKKWKRCWTFDVKKEK